MAAFAVMLMALLVVQTPVAMVDRLLHATGHGHAANGFAGALIDAPDQDHDHGGDHDHHEPDADHDRDAAEVRLVADDAPNDPAAPSPHHHHQDSPSIYGLAGGLSLPLVRSAPAVPFRLDDDLRHGIGEVGRDRPPKAKLAHVA
jgi:hypothetical protein